MPAKLHSQTPCRDPHSSYYYQSHCSRIPKRPEYVRVLPQQPALHQMTPQQLAHTRQSGEPDHFVVAQPSEGEGSSDFSEYSLATVQSAPLYPTLSYSRGIPASNPPLWYSPGYHSAHTHRGPTHYDRSRGISKHFVNFHPHTRRTGSGTARIRSTINECNLSGPFHDDSYMYAQPIWLETNVDGTTSVPVRKWNVCSLGHDAKATLNRVTYWYHMMNNFIKAYNLL